MPNYSESKIFIVKSSTHPTVYVSCTTDTRLCAKMSSLRSYHKNATSSLADLLRSSDAKIELLEKFPCSSKAELHERVKYWESQYSNILEKSHKDARERVECECGCVMYRYSLVKHMTSIRHAVFLQKKATLD